MIITQPTSPKDARTIAAGIQKTITDVKYYDRNSLIFSILSIFFITIPFAIYYCNRADDSKFLLTKQLELTRSEGGPEVESIRTTALNLLKKIYGERSRPYVDLCKTLAVQDPSPRSSSPEETWNYSIGHESSDLDRTSSPLPEDLVYLDDSELESDNE